MSNKQLKQTKSLRANRGGTRKSGQQDGMKTIMRERKERILSISDIVPAKVLVKSKFLLNSILNNAGFSAASKQLNANGAFDPDPTVASPGLTGFAEWGAFYQRYRVVKVDAKCTFASRESFPVLVNLGFEPIAYAANSKILGNFENHNQKTLLVPAVGGPSCTLAMSKAAEEVVGDISCMTDNNYTGTSGSNPGSLWYTSIAVSSVPLSTVLVNGVVVRYECTYHIEFYEPKTLVV